MKTRCLLALAAIAAASSAWAAWYWPFGSDEDKGGTRLSDLVEQASLEIDDAVDAASSGKMDEALEHYRKALDELDRVVRENPAIAELPEYGSIRNKREYVSAAIDSILLEQSRENAKAVQVTDTSELEKKFEARRRRKLGLDAPPVPAAAPAAKEEATAPEDSGEKEVAASSQGEAEDARPAKKGEAAKPQLQGKAEALPDRAEIDKMLELRPDDAKALNMRARLEAQAGDWRAAEATLDRAIMTNPRSYHAYYNMAALILKFRPDSREAARRYYETGRDIGGPVHKGLERAFR